MARKKSQSWIYSSYSSIFSPATFLMTRLNFTRRAVILAFLTLIAFSIVTSHLYIRLTKVIDIADRELNGLTILSPLFKTVQLMQQHRGLSTGVLSGTSAFKALRLPKQNKTDEAFKKFEAVLPSDTLNSETWKKISHDWLLVKTQGMEWSVEENFTKQTNIISQLLLLSQAISDNYALTNHPDLGTYYLLNTTTHQLASVQEFLGQARAFGTGILGEKKSSERQKAHISILMSKIDKAVLSLQRNLKKTARYNPSIEPTLTLSSQETLKNSQFIFDLVESDILHERYLTSPEEFIQIMTDTIDKTYDTMYQVLFPTTKMLITKQRTQAKQVLVMSAAVVLIAFLVILYFSIGIYIATAKGIDSISKTTLAFARGDLTSRLQIDSRSELKILGKNFNHMANELTRLINTEKEDKARINSIIDSAYDALVQINSNGEIIGWSHQAESIFGWKRSDILGKSLSETIIPSHDQETYVSELNLFLEHSEDTHINRVREKTARHNNGHDFPIEMSISPIKIKNDYEFNFFIRDISERKAIEKTLLVSEERYRNIFENALTEIFVFDADSLKFIKANRGACKNIGYTEKELYELTPIDIKPEMTLKQFNTLIKPLREGTKEAVHFECAHQRKDGSLYYVEIYLQSCGFSHNPAFVAITLDVTERKIAEEKLQLSAKVFSETNEGISITDPKGIVMDVNPAFCDITGYSRADVIGHNLNILSSGKQSSSFYAEMWQSLSKNGHWQGEVWNRKKEGDLYAELLSISSILDENGKVLHYVGIFTDITHSKKQQETLEYMAHYDVLTKLPNRVLLADRFTLAIAHSKRNESLLAVCFLDIDYFKPVNDLYGHAIGDQLLIQITGRIKSIIRAEDTLSRQGGDEFILLLGDIESFSQCEQMLKRVLNSLNQSYLIDDQPISISASIGVSLYPADNADLDTLVRHADQAMYQAKSSGRNRYCQFNAKEYKITIDKENRLKEIRHALVNKEFCLYYQPKVNMKTGKVFGAEALIRWNHPEKGLIPPFQFLPIIDETELEILIGNWVINEALNQLTNWNEKGIQLEMSVNISSYHFRSTSFIANLEATLAKYPRVNSKHLQLEILESSALGDLESISNIVQTSINHLGVKIALDDFGTGYSSLTHLRNLSVQTIKIDQTFVRDMLDDPNDFVIIDSIIGLADSFYCEVIAEGVETTEDGLMLLSMGCVEAQGYRIARPMPANDFPAWLTNYSPIQQWITSANKPSTQQTQKIDLLKLTVAQWQKRFEANILSEPADLGHWPIQKKTNCHCGIWIRRAKQELLFDKQWIDKLDKEHGIMHSIADDLFDKYQQGNIEAARAGLTGFQSAIKKLSDLVEQYA